MTIKSNKFVDSTSVNDDSTRTTCDIRPSAYTLQLIVTRKLDVNRDVKRNVRNGILWSFVTFTAGQKNQTRKEKKCSHVTNILKFSAYNSLILSSQSAINAASFCFVASYSLRTSVCVLFSSKTKLAICASISAICFSDSSILRSIC
jgi:hypothetical protein